MCLSVVSKDVNKEPVVAYKLLTRGDKTLVNRLPLTMEVRQSPSGPGFHAFVNKEDAERVLEEIKKQWGDDGLFLIKEVTLYESQTGVLLSDWGEIDALVGQAIKLGGQ